MELYRLGLAFVLGAILGSAANALIDRLPRNVSWMSGRSKCDKCRHVLDVGDLVPVLSYVMLLGRCRYCHSPINTRNFLLEIFLGIGFVIIFWDVVDLIPAMRALVLGLILWVTTIIAIMDAETKLVADSMVGMWGGLVIIWHLLTRGQTVYEAVVGLILGAVVIWSLWFFSQKKAMGDGDIGIAAVVGLMAGTPGVLVALWTAFVLGGIYGVWQLMARKAKMKSEIAFGPFLILGGWVAVLFGDMMIGYVFAI